MGFAEEGSDETIPCPRRLDSLHSSASASNTHNRINVSCHTILQPELGCDPISLAGCGANHFDAVTDGVDGESDCEFVRHLFDAHDCIA